MTDKIWEIAQAAAVLNNDLKAEDVYRQLTADNSNQRLESLGITVSLGNAAEYAEKHIPRLWRSGFRRKVYRRLFAKRYQVAQQKGVIEELDNVIGAM
jgi:hypothetical protein